MNLKASQLLYLVLFPLMLSCLTSCSDFVEDKAPDSPPATKPPVEQQKPSTTSIPASPANDSSSRQTSPDAPKLDVSGPKKTTQPEETEEARNKRWCREERGWALEMHHIDMGAFNLYQARDFAPAFNVPGQPQSGIEGWYACKLALQLNGFVAAEPARPIEF